MRRTKASQPLKSKIEVPWDTTAIDRVPTEPDRSLAIDLIVLPDKQPRRYFDPETLNQLAQSVRQHGILQPLLVRPYREDRYELVAGERRYRAALEVGLAEVPVVIRELDDRAAFELALIENLLREDLNPVDETEGIVQLLALRLNRLPAEIPALLRRLQHWRKEAAKSKNHLVEIDGGENLETSNNVIGSPKLDRESPDRELTHSDRQEKSEDGNKAISGQKQSELTFPNNVIGKNRSHTSSQSELHESELKAVEEVFANLALMTWESFANNRLPLLNLPEDILSALRGGKVEYTKAKAIAQIQDRSQRVTFLEQSIAQNWSLSEIKQRLSDLKENSPTAKSASQDYKERITAATHKLRKSNIWSDPKKRKQLDKLLVQLEALIDGE